MTSGRWLVPLPDGAEPPYEVFVNGVPQEEGRDYRLADHALAFYRPLAKEGRLGFLRWLSIFLGLVGTYRQNDSVDVRYEHAGRPALVESLDIEIDGEP